MVFPLSGHLTRVAYETYQRVKMEGLPTVPISVTKLAHSTWRSLTPALVDSQDAASSSNAPVSEALLSCSNTALNLFGMQIDNPALIPTCLLAALIGLTGFCRIRRTTTTGHFSYSISFLMFGIMMSDAMFVNCFLYQPNFIGVLVEWIDVTLTSCVALSFGFNGLVDLGLLKGTGRGIKIAMIVTYLTTAIAWLFCIKINSSAGFMFLYVGIIAISCGIYTVAEFVSIVLRKGTGLLWLILGGGFGGFGLFSIVSPTFNLALCAALGVNLGGEFFWFLCSDLAMWALMHYYLERSESDSKRHQRAAAMEAAYPAKIPPTLTTTTTTVAEPLLKMPPVV